MLLIIYFTVIIAIIIYVNYTKHMILEIGSTKNLKS